jgi:hypothetical protein
MLLELNAKESSQEPFQSEEKKFHGWRRRKWGSMLRTYILELRKVALSV